MSNEKKNAHNDSPRQELSPKVHEAVEYVLKNPVPEALTSRVLKAAQAQVLEYPRKAKTKRRRTVRTIFATAASIALMVTAAYCYTIFYTVHTEENQLNQNQPLANHSLPNDGSLADAPPISKSENCVKESDGDESDEEEPNLGNFSTVGTYSQAARQSPETFEALLERQVWQSNSAKQRAALKRLADLL